MDQCKEVMERILRVDYFQYIFVADYGCVFFVKQFETRNFLLCACEAFFLSGLCIWITNVHLQSEVGGSSRQH
jgi:hypothetical protein